MRGLIYIIMLLVITGCGASVSQPRELDEAQRLMASDPSAALSRLNSVDISQIKDSSVMARWALLYSEAMVAGRLTAPTDTIVNIAVDYYGRHNLRDEFQRASRLKALIMSTGESDELATALYLQKEKEFMLYRERAARQRHMFIGVIILLVAVSVIEWMRQRMKLQSAQNEVLMAEASGLRCQIDESRRDVSRLEEKLHGLLAGRFALIDSLCQTYYESQGTRIEKKAIIDKVRSEIEGVRTDSFAEMEQAVNDCRESLAMRVKEVYPAISADDYRLFIYLASGLSTRTVCLLLGESADVVYKRKSRLRSRLREHVAASCPDVIDVL
ncbi:MAG: hypothetical protein K2K92_01875 [Duncaniella sp.]|nr:hypothetical protein [Duncaniella sp.]